MAQPMRCAGVAEDSAGGCAVVNREMISLWSSAAIPGKWSGHVLRLVVRLGIAVAETAHSQDWLCYWSSSSIMSCDEGMAGVRGGVECAEVYRRVAASVGASNGCGHCADAVCVDAKTSQNCGI